ncbi:MAG: phage tail protein [Oscillospiraceae bacterium]|nr:phage tail protein [Oscillospiraceae bacterium]
MYIIEIENNGVTELLHEMNPQSLRRVSDCDFTDDLNSVDSANITVPLQNPAYANLHELTTLVRIINTRTGETEFDGRILQISEESMDSNGVITKKVICEGVLGYLCDSVQLYHHYQDTEVTGFLASLLDYHNYIMGWHSPERCILLGAVTVHGDASKTTAQRSTMEEIKENLISRLGGILHTRRNENNQIVLDYYREEDFGQVCTDTTVEIAVNMKSISSGTDTTGIITRLYPLGCQINDETSERLTISGVNNGCPYIDDEDAIIKYGVKCGTYTWNDVTLPENLLTKGQEYLNQSCQIKKNYQAVVLDLSTIGKAADSFRAGNTYRFVNQLIGLDEYLKIIRRTVNIFSPYQPTIEIGDKTEAVTDIVTQTRNYVEYEVPKQKSEILQQAKDNASALITAATHGHVVVEPEEILIMDTDNKDTATKIWRFNINGLGYSHSNEPGGAYNGEYGLAMTMDGAIVADYITTGTMYADRIKGGTLTVGGYNNDNGVINVRNSNGEVICLFDQNGADILGSIKTRNNSDYWMKLDGGSLIGGQGGNTYTTINATGQITDGDNHITYNGLLIESDAIDFRCKLFAINGGTGTSGNMTLVSNIELQESSIEVVTNAWMDENGYLQTNKAIINYISGYSIGSITYYFQNGIMVTGLN